MIQVSEVGRRLRVVVGGEAEPAEEDVFLIPPVDVRTGSLLLSTFLGLFGAVVSDLTDPSDHLATDLSASSDMTMYSFGCLVPADSENLTPLEQARRDSATELMERSSNLRWEEQYELTNAAFFWQTQGGFEAARAIAEDGADGYPKALDLLARKSGLEIFAMLASTGSSSGQAEPTTTPSTSTRGSSETSSSEQVPAETPSPTIKT